MTDVSSLRERLLEDHRRLEQLFDDVLVKLGENDREVTALAWSTFEAALTGHLDAEEKFILPLMRATHAAEVDGILGEHLVFRKRLEDLCVAVDLHFIRADVAKDFMTSLRAHAQREDSMMYRWADENLHPEERTRLLAALDHVRTLVNRITA